MLARGSLSPSLQAASGLQIDTQGCTAEPAASILENSPYGVFRLDGVAGQALTLALANDNDPATADAAIGTDLGNTLGYLDGKTWKPYTAGTPVPMPASGKLLVRVAITDDTPFEGPESFNLLGTPVGGIAAVGEGVIRDDGQGSIFPDTITGKANPKARKDDDRVITINDIVVNEASPYAVFNIQNPTTHHSALMA